MRTLFSVALLHILAHPIRHFAVAYCVLHDFDELLLLESGDFKPAPVETFAEVGLVIGMQLACEVKTNLIDVTRQMHPAAHRFARAARINNLIAHRFYSFRKFTSSDNTSRYIPAP